MRSQGTMLDRFLKEDGLALLAYCAHPSNTYKYSNYRINNSNIWVDIYYKDGFETTLTLYKNDGIYTNINISYNNDVPAFLLVYLIKEAISKSGDQNATDSETKLERYLHKKFEDMSGQDLTCALFDAALLTYSVSDSNSGSNGNTNNNSLVPVYSTPGLYPQATDRYLTGDDLNAMSTYDLKIMRNEIFARHGYIFQTQQMKAHFEAQNWYRGYYDNVDNLLTVIEKSNIALIKSYENR